MLTCIINVHAFKFNFVAPIDHKNICTQDYGITFMYIVYVTDCVPISLSFGQSSVVRREGNNSGKVRTTAQGKREALRLKLLCSEHEIVIAYRLTMAAASSS